MDQVSEKSPYCRGLLNRIVIWKVIDDLRGEFYIDLIGHLVPCFVGLSSSLTSFLVMCSFFLAQEPLTDFFHYIVQHKRSLCKSLS
jgi:hypothetical protein|uniref:Uncharacterized protein n=2 Tax=Mus TaxID=862507 RepID=Q3ULS7_MOUSE|nr:unnamed protein product [Mus musculus]